LACCRASWPLVNAPSAAPSGIAAYSRPICPADICQLPAKHPLRALLAGLTFLCQSPLIGGIALLGGLLTMASAGLGQLAAGQRPQRRAERNRGVQQANLSGRHLPAPVPCWRG
jgi:hypothetical protein